MKRVGILTIAVCLGSLVTLAWAEDKPATPSPDKPKAEAPASEVASVRAKMHRTMAELIEARAAEKPDQAKIAELTRTLQELRVKLPQQAVTPGAAPPVGWMCPRGAGFGMGRGYRGGRGPGGGWGAGAGLGFGAGMGPGAGMGLAPGGPAFVDQDQDGLCDHYEVRHGLHPHETTK